ncbi:MAG: ZIP family metal transporter [Hyphomicrobiaceae bacterium]
MSFTSTLWVFLAALVTALATGVGALPLLALRDVPRRWMALSTAAAGGLMLAASHALIAEGVDLNASTTMLGILAGLGGILVGQRLVADAPPIPALAADGIDPAKALLIVGVMTAHSFAEGVGVGVSFGGTTELATFITTAIAIHNIPEGLAIALLLVPAGMSVTRAAGWAVFSSLPQPLMAVPAFVAVEVFRPFLPFGLGLAAGAMIWMVIAELLPDTFEDAEPRDVGIAVTLAFTAMLAFQLLVLKH